EAAGEHRRALADFQPLAAAAPDNVDLQRNLEVAEGNLCESLTRVGQVSNALEHCRVNVAVAEAMVRADPDNAQALEDLGAAYATMGFALHTANQPSNALEFERRGEAQYRLAAARDPDSLAAATAHIDSLLEVARIEAVLHHGRACWYVREAGDLLHGLAAQSSADRNLASAVEEVGHLASCPSGPRTGTVKSNAPQ